MRIGGRKVQNQTNVRWTARQHVISPFLRLIMILREFVSFAPIVFGGCMSKPQRRRSLVRPLCKDVAAAGTDDDSAAIKTDIVVRQVCVFLE